MALKKCKECGHEISSNAKACPNCGKPQTKNSTIGCLLIVILFIIFIIVSNNKTDTTKTNPEPIGATSIVNEIQDVTPLSKKGKNIKKVHPDWNNDDCNVIAEKKVRIGMRRDQVIAAWGKPYQVNETKGSWGIHEQWVMSDSMYSDYLYFENGILTSMQQTK
jgi:hypothetical protein